MVGTPLEVMAESTMDRDAKKIRGERPFGFSNLKPGQSLPDSIDFIERQGMLA